MAGRGEWTEEAWSVIATLLLEILGAQVWCQVNMSAHAPNVQAPLRKPYACVRFLLDLLLCNPHWDEFAKST